jgi:hypothetical protein
VCVCVPKKLYETVPARDGRSSGIRPPDDTARDEPHTLLIRLDPDAARAWSDEEVVR